MTTGMAWRPVSNMVMMKNKVTNGVAWCPVSDRVSLKGIFLICPKSSKQFISANSDLNYIILKKVIQKFLLSYKKSLLLYNFFFIFYY